MQEIDESFDGHDVKERHKVKWSLKTSLVED